MSDESVKASVLAAIDESEVIDLVQTLVRIPSNNPPGEEKDIAEFLGSYFEDLGLDAEMKVVFPNRPNIIATWGDQGGPCLILNGHVDVVPPGEGWELDPFSGALVDGKIWGRGSTDMKGGLAAMILAVKALKKARVDLKGCAKITAVMGEEQGQFGTRQLVQDGVEADFAIVGEPTSLTAVIAHKGTNRFEITTGGKAAHGSTPHLGINAIYKMCDFIAALRKLEDELRSKQHPILGHPTVSVGTIQGGLWTCVVPDRCSITVDRRVIPGERNEDVERELQELITDLRAHDPQFDADLVNVAICPPMEISQDEEIVTTVRAVAQEVTGTETSIEGWSATADSNILVNFGGIPTVIFGPGDIALAHKANEYVDVEEVVAATKIYALTMLHLLT